MAEALPLTVVGGTFDHLHAGHKRLLSEAFRHARKVGIGVTTDQLVKAFPDKGGGIAPYAEREGILKVWLRRLYPASRWFIVPLETPEGKIHDPETPALAVSEETFPTAVKANVWRREHRMEPLTLIVVGRLYGEDLLPIASRRIRSGDIDLEGRRLSVVVLGLKSPMETEVRTAFLEAFRQVLGNAQVTPRYLEGEKASGAERPADFTFEVKEDRGGVSLEVTDRDGVRCESSATPGGGGPALHPLQEKGILRPLASHLVSGAFAPRLLSRGGALPPSVVVEGSRSEHWPTSAVWTRKLYSPSGIFPYQ